MEARKPNRLLRSILAAVASLIGLLAVLPVLLLTLPFWTVAWLTRRLARRLEPPYVNWNEVFSFDPDLGWKPKPNLDTYHLADEVLKVTTDAEGWRGRRTLAESQVVVLGDSFAWGHGIDDRHFFADLPSELRVKAIGSNGYSLVQELIWLRGSAAELEGKMLVWLVFYGNDLHENLTPHMRGYRRPFLRENGSPGEWEIVSSHLRRDIWPFVSRFGTQLAKTHEKLAEACTSGFQADRIFRACEFLIREGKEICDRAGATLVLVGIPDPVQLDSEGANYLASLISHKERLDPLSPDKQLKAICRRIGVRFVPLSEHLDRSHYNAVDCHWNRKGHATVAALLAHLHGEVVTSPSGNGGPPRPPRQTHVPSQRVVATEAR